MEEELAPDLGLDAVLLRRNVVIRGVVLESLIGQEFSLGTALVRGVRACDPCLYREGMDRPGLFVELAGRRGIRADVVRRGTVCVGDRIKVVANSMVQVTGGP